MIELTVGIPMFRAKYIGWLPMESLIRQEDIDFEWELIIIEELSNSEVFGLDNIMKYKESLKNVGCVEIKYTPLKAWIPLAEKHRRLGQATAETSRIYASNAADNYSAPKRLARHYEAFKENIQCHLPTKGVYYSLSENIAYVRDTDHSHRKDDVAGIARCSKSMRKIQTSKKLTAIDMWMWQQHIKIARETGSTVAIKIDDSDNWKYGLNVRGFNNISDLNFSKVKFNKERAPYPVDEIKKHIPAEVMKRLKDSCVNLGKHKRSFS